MQTAIWTELETHDQGCTMAMERSSALIKKIPVCHSMSNPTFDSMTLSSSHSHCAFSIDRCGCCLFIPVLRQAVRSGVAQQAYRFYGTYIFCWLRSSYPMALQVTLVGAPTQYSKAMTYELWTSSHVFQVYRIDNRV